MPVQIDAWRIDPAAPAAAAFSLSDPGPAPITLAPGAELGWKVTCTPTWRSGTRHAGFLLDSSLAIGATLLDIACAMGPF